MKSWRRFSAAKPFFFHVFGMGEIFLSVKLLKSQRAG
jgi:hypothetical protein